jgi:hypothetical protein
VTSTEPGQSRRGEIRYQRVPYWRGIIAVMDLNRDLPSQLRPYVRDGRISAIPAKRAARLLLLDQVAQAFEPGRRYPELAVNEILKALYDDHAALRRYLVDEDLLSRTPGGIYWRSGGTVPVEVSPMDQAR